MSTTTTTTTTTRDRGDRYGRMEWAQSNYPPDESLQEINVIVHCIGDGQTKFSDECGRTQRRHHITDGLLWIHHMLVAQRNRVLSQFRRLRGRLFRLVLPPDCGAGVHQQLHQPFRLRRQVPRVPARRQTFDVETKLRGLENIRSVFYSGSTFQNRLALTFHLRVND